MGGKSVQLAVNRSLEILSVYAPEKPPRFATGDLELVQPAQSVNWVQKALTETQFVLNQASTTGCETGLMLSTRSAIASSLTACIC